MSAPIPTVEFIHDDERMDALIAVAFNVGEALGKMCCDDARRDFVRDLFDRHDVVWCVWHVGKIVRAVVVKGETATGYVDETALLVPNEGYADRMRATLGDDRPAITNEASWRLQ